MTRTEAVKAACQNDGWLSHAEAGALYDLAYSARGPIIEIGSHWGRSTAVLALGSMAGRGFPVYAIDSFEGVPSTDRKTNQGVNPGQKSSSPELLRANLDRVGVNGIVKIIPKSSRDAVDDVPNCGVLFVDGGHDYPTVSMDLREYLPKIMPEGMAMFHDVVPGDPGVVKAVEEIVLTDKSHWRFRGRVDSAVVAKRTNTARRNVLLGLPGNSFCYGTLTGATDCTLGNHEVQLPTSPIASGWDDFNALWAMAINSFEEGTITHFAMLHSDVKPAVGWLDVLIGEMEDRDADMVSTILPIKDTRGITSTGIGDPNDNWGPFRRFTMREVMDMPETFSVNDTQYPNKFLLHNTGCWVCDLRKPVFHTVGVDGNLHCFFDFPTRICRGPDGKWMNGRESEDWFFSRKLAELDANTYASRIVQASHQGTSENLNTFPWGTYTEGDNDTRHKWDPDFVRE